MTKRPYNANERLKLEEKFLGRRVKVTGGYLHLGETGIVKARVSLESDHVLPHFYVKLDSGASPKLCYKDLTILTDEQKESQDADSPK